METSTYVEIIIAVIFIVLSVLTLGFLLKEVLSMGFENDLLPLEMSVSYMYTTSLPGNFSIKLPAGFESLFEYRMVIDNEKVFSFEYGYCTHLDVKEQLLKSAAFALGVDIVMDLTGFSKVYENLPDPAQDIILIGYVLGYDLPIKTGRWIYSKSLILRPVVFNVKNKFTDPVAQKIAMKLAMKTPAITAKYGIKLAVGVLGKLGGLLSIGLIALAHFAYSYLSVIFIDSKHCLHSNTDIYNNIENWDFYPNLLFNVNAEGECQKDGSKLVKCRIDPSDPSKKEYVIAYIMFNKTESLNNWMTHRLNTELNGVSHKKFEEFKLWT